MNFLDYLRANPNGRPYSRAEHAVQDDPRLSSMMRRRVQEDDAGGLFDEYGPYYSPSTNPSSPAEFGLNVATAPARMATDLASSLSPYGEDGWRVPPLVSETWDAITTPGRLLSGEAMTDDQIRHAGSVMAGLAMTGGLVAPAEENALASGLRSMSGRKPTRVYHGTAAVTDFNTFNRPPWMTDVPEVASAAAYPDISPEFEYLRNPGAPRVFPLHIEPSNPFVINYADTSFGDPVKTAMQRHGYDWNGFSDVHDLALVKGHDFVIHDNVAEDFGVRTPHRQIVPLRPGTVRSATTGEILFSNGSKPGAGVGMMNALADEGRPGITAYHGSPHDFDKFDFSKIGTGEGAQAYGHGLYFAENEGVARSYRDALKHNVVRLDGLPTSRELAIDELSNRIRDAIPGAKQPYNAAKMLTGWISEGATPEQIIQRINAGAWQPELKSELNLVADALQNWVSGDVGKMYQVRINANPEDFLDWDKPLGGQSERVRNALAPLQREHDRPYIGNMTGQDAYRGAQGGIEPGKFVDQDAVVPHLREAGIPGIRYLDQGSRAAGEGTSNYVVFDDSLVEILKKYGFIPPALYGANALSQPHQDQ